MNLHDWIDELCDALDIDADIDEGLILDLAKVVATNVVRPAAPVSAFLLGIAVGRTDASAEETERLAGIAQELAERWDRPAGLSEDADDADDAGDAGDASDAESDPPDLDFGEDAALDQPGDPEDSGV